MPTLTLQLSEEELVALTARAAAAGKTVEEWVRSHAQPAAYGTAEDVLCDLGKWMGNEGLRIRIPRPLA